MNTHNLRIEFGKFKGELWTRLPVSYLRWIVNNSGFIGRGERELAQSELERRGTVLPEIEISGHAIDKVSLRALDLWQGSKRKREGIHHWLHRQCLAAIAAAGRLERIEHLGLILVFDHSGCMPALKTVIRQACQNQGVNA